MRFDTKAILKLMKQSWKGGGVKIRRFERGLRDMIFLTGAGWALLIPKESCPGELAAQMVIWLADMPRIGDSKWVVKGSDPQDIPTEESDADLRRFTSGSYDTGLGCLPLRTETDALFQYGEYRAEAAAFPLEAAAVIASGANLGFIDPTIHIARWKDEVTEALFWVCDNVGNVPQDVLDAAKRFVRQEH